MSSALHLFIHQRMARLRQECRQAEATIARSQHIEDIVRLADSIHVPPECRSLLRPDQARVKEAASKRIEALLPALPARRYRTVYSILCGRYPRLAMRVQTMMTAQKQSRNACPDLKK